MSDDIAPPVPRRPVPWKGRPRVENPRNAWVHIRVTADERAALEAAAERVEMPLGPYIVSAAMNAPKRRSTRKPAVERVMLSQALGWLGKAGSNLNQIAKAMNSGENVMLDEIAKTIAELNEVGRAVMGAIRSRPVE